MLCEVIVNNYILVNNYTYSDERVFNMNVLRIITALAVLHITVQPRTVPSRGFCHAGRGARAGDRRRPATASFDASSPAQLKWASPR